MVLTQALSSGLPVLTTYDTGGSDLMLSEVLCDNIVLIKSNSLEELISGIDYMVDRIKNKGGFKKIQDCDRELLSWSGYAKRYQNFLYESLS
jgi:glycosyltransferase involved in cell wall biosynthesis